ncbi:putative nucleotide-binding alpha-beta plait domain superfamily, RNA-binding domain superfamily [Helianthus anomalus]
MGKNRFAFRQDPVEMQQLRKRKEEEQHYLIHAKGRNDQEWNTVMSKNDKKREKWFAEREARIRLDTSFFVANIPEDCTKARLWRAFEPFENLTDASFQRKRTVEAASSGLSDFPASRTPMNG